MHKVIRDTVRLPVSFKGEIDDGNGKYRCLVQDMSSSGMLLVCNKPFPTGQVLDLTVEYPPPRSALVCKVEVRHCDDTAMGVQIVEISAQDPQGYQHHVREEAVSK